MMADDDTGNINRNILKCKISRRANLAEIMKERPQSWSFTHEIARLELPVQKVLDIRPLGNAPTSLWIALTVDGMLLRLDLSHVSSHIIARLPEAKMSWIAEEVSASFPHQEKLILSPSGRFAAIVNRWELHGVVLDLSSGQIVMSLERGAYHAGHCDFPLAMTERDNRSLLVHGADWNRVDITDLVTGTVMTERDSPKYVPGQQVEHYLDYFHSGLLLSPNGEWIANNGWMWGSSSLTTTWSLKHWLETNVWESEDGLSRQEFFYREHRVDPICWIDSRTLAIWGYDEDEEDTALSPGLRVFDVVSGEEVRAFCGPEGELFFDEYLFSCSVEKGTAIWDVQTGERLYLDATFCPTRYHPGTKQFLTLRDEVHFQVSRLDKGASHT